MAIFLRNMLSLLIWFIIIIHASCHQDHEFTYNTGFDNKNSNMTLSGTSLVHKNGVVQLTNETSRGIGYAFYPTPLVFKNSTNGTVFSFSTCFAFSMHPLYPKLGGNGLSFTILRSSPLPTQHLSDVRNLSNHLFTLEFDNDNHVWIFTNRLEANSIAAYYDDDDSSKIDLDLQGGKPVLAWIDYDSVTSLVNVTLSPFSWKPKTPLLSFQMDLTPILEQNMYVGFYASTGLLASSNYILGWNFKINGEAHSLNLDALPLVPGTKSILEQYIVRFSVLAVFVCLILIANYLVIRRRRNKKTETTEPWELELGPCRYNYLDLKQATNNFSETELLGFGGFGRVYKGTLPSTNVNVAVKRMSHQSQQGFQEFVSEILTIGRLRHRNLVQLLGWCRHGADDLLLVYNFMPNGSLEKLLFNKHNCVLSWKQRFKIIKGVASGLLYLHEGYEKVVLHRDVKASNVLVDCEMNGKLGDFGLAKLYDHGTNPVTTRVVGTLGYVAPELLKTGRSTTSSDVFAFGTLLLEVACGRRPVESKACDDDLVLVDLVWSKYRQGKILDMVDEKMMGNFDVNEVLLVLKLGLMCLSYEQVMRPSMRQVLSYLEREVEMTMVVRPPGPGGRRQERAFEDHLHSYAFSSLDKSSSSSYVELGNGNVESMEIV